MFEVASIGHVVIERHKTRDIMIRLTSIFRRPASFFGRLTLTIAALMLIPATVLAQGYPTKPVKIVVPFPPGGPTDVVARMVAMKLSQAYNQQFVVENRPGTGGTIGSQAVAQSSPDGYTLLLGSTSSLAMAPSLYKSLGYDPKKSFSPISLLSSSAQLIAVNSNVPATSLQQLIALAKDKPGTLAYASAGNGTPPHIAAEMFKSLAGVDLLHVPYKGGGPALIAVAGGEAQVIFEGLVTVLPQIKSGRIRALAITGNSRDEALPDVPTVSEAGLGAFQVNFWSGLVAPAGTPPPVLASLNDALRKSLASSDAKETLTKLGLASAINSPAEFSRFIDTELVRWTKVIQSSGAKVD
jgi:tripartite-type tricarboxylate transporter receptor subunit TctC